MNNNKKVTELKLDNDFGFTFEDDGLHDSLNEEVSDLKRRLHDLRSIFMPLLENLSKNPDKAMIKWPNRKAVLEEQMRKLKDLTEV